MKSCFSTLGCPDWNVDQIIETVRELSFDGIEIRGLENEMFLPDSPHLQAESGFLSELERAGCTVAVLGSSASFIDGQQALEECNEFVKTAEAIGCPIVRIFGGNIPDDFDRLQALQQMRPALTEACEFADSNGITLGLETHDGWCRGDECRQLLDTIDHPRLKIVWDSHHSYRHGEPPADTMAAIGDDIVHVHLKDSFRRDGKAQYTLFGQGDVPIADILGVLEGAEYRGFLSLEWEKKWHPDLPEPEVAFFQFAQKLGELLEGRQ